MKKLQGEIAGLEAMLSLMTGGDRVLVSIGYPFDKILRPIFGALGYKTTDLFRGGCTKKRLMIGRMDPGHPRYYLIPEGVAEALEPILKDVVDAISEEALSTITYAITELTKKCLVKIETFFDANEAEKAAKDRIASLLKLEVRWEDEGKET